MDMQSLVDDLENLVQHATHLPTGRILIEEAALREIIDGLRGSVPDEVRLGQKIASERERILADARAQSRRMLEDSQAQINSKLDEHATAQAARQRAKEILAEAEQKATALRSDSNLYVANQLNALEARLQRLLREVQAGQRALAHEGSDHSDSSGRS